MKRMIMILGIAIIFTGCMKSGSQTEQDDSELANIRKYAAAEVSIEHLRKQKEPDWDAICAEYEKTALIVKNVKESYDTAIRDAIKKCAAGEKVKVNQQILAKGLQHVTVLAIRAQLDQFLSTHDAGKRKMAVDNIAAYFVGIQPTFLRRDKDYFKGVKTLEAAADNAITTLAASAETGEGLVTGARELEDVIARTYALCVKYEIAGVEKNRDTDKDACEVKLIEGLIFYRIIQERIKKTDSECDAVIVKMFGGSFDQMDSGVLSKCLEKGLKLELGI